MNSPWVFLKIAIRLCPQVLTNQADDLTCILGVIPLYVSNRCEALAMQCPLITGACALAVLLTGTHPAASQDNPIDVVEQFRRHCAQQEFDAAAILSVQGAARLQQHDLVQQMIRAAASRRYWRAADWQTEADRAAVLWAVHPQQASDERTVEALGLVRSEGEWKVDLEWPPERQTSQSAADQSLMEWLERRQREILSIVNAKSLPCYPFSGVWSTHHRTTFMKLIFSSDGQVVMLTIQDGSHGTDIWDYHMENAEIVIESRFGPLRLKPDADRQFTTGGISYDYLVMQVPEALKEAFPFDEIRFQPSKRTGGRAVARPLKLFETRGQLRQPDE